MGERPKGIATVVNSKNAPSWTDEKNEKAADDM